jgi:hypothetical protein
VSASITRESLLAAAREELRPGLRPEQAIVIAYARLAGSPLDPFGFDDAAVILRAERLLLDGLGVTDAVATAREELVTWSVRA